MYRFAPLAGAALLLAHATPVALESSGPPPLAAVAGSAASPPALPDSGTVSLAEPEAAAFATMVRIPATRYRPLYASPGTEIVVAPFRLDRDPVTRGQYLAFVRANPRWRRDRVDTRAADAGYLAEWRTSDDAGTATDLRRPVTGVSRTAAEAYCAVRGTRLPSLSEWEAVAAASAVARDATGDPEFVQTLLSRYAHRTDPVPPVERGTRNAYGIRGMHDLVWEWVAAPHIDHAAHSHETGTEHGAYCASAAVGASNAANYPAFLRFAVRSGLTDRSTMGTLGFRCAA